MVGHWEFWCFFVLLIRKELKPVLEVNWNIQSFPEGAVLTDGGLCTFCCSPALLNCEMCHKPTGYGGSQRMAHNKVIWYWPTSSIPPKEASLALSWSTVTGGWGWSCIAHARLPRSGPWGAAPTCLMWLRVLPGTQICCPTQCSGAGLVKMFHCCNFSRASMRKNKI